MACSVPVSAPVLVAIDLPPVRSAPHTQRVLGIALLIAVVALDQSTKAWAWRHAPGASINTGSTLGMGGPLNRWFSGPVTGAVLDSVDFGLLTLCGLVLLRTPRRSGVFVSAILMIAGWASNLSDRLGMHMLTAPGSVRGAVDFIPLGPWHCNIADVFIVGATIAFLAVMIRPGEKGRFADLTRVRPAARPPASRHSGASRPARVRSTAVGLTVAVALWVDVSIGVAHYWGVHHPTASGAHWGPSRSACGRVPDPTSATTLCPVSTPLRRQSDKVACYSSPYRRRRSSGLRPAARTAIASCALG